MNIFEGSELRAVEIRPWRRCEELNWTEASKFTRGDTRSNIEEAKEFTCLDMEEYNGARSWLDDASDAVENEDVGLGWSKTCDVDQDGLSRSRTWTYEHTHYTQPRAHNVGESGYFSEKRRFSLQLPSFQSLGISTLPTFSIQNADTLDFHAATEPHLHEYSMRSDLQASALRGIAPPLTPPPEEISTLKPIYRLHSTRSDNNTSSMAQSEQSEQNSVHTNVTNTGGRIPGITIPQPSGVTESSQLRKLPWISQASRKLLTTLNESSARDQIQVISQTLPCQAIDGRSRPTFEEILETLQTEMDTSPYITITHAVPLARSMEELPKTPPSTPNFRRETHDYFGSDQTIFTHAAAVPIYHSHERLDPNLAGRLVHHIAAPCSVQVSILERYIPPTMPEEIDDFFTSSTRSYLADRLSELSLNNGSLLLIYPTRKGGETFARRYIGPVIDPFLRRFVMLNGLTSDAAARMGNMTAVSNMIDFEEMHGRITNLCEILSARPTGRGPRGIFSISNAETATVTLDRSTWINWYIEQEQSRLRQNLVEYHQSGGRMPEVEGIREVTVGMLTRDFIDGVQKSQESAGNSGIEVAVFLITRSRAQ